MSSQNFGPFYHHLNKGGFDDIMNNKRMLSTERKNTMTGSGVRAWRGPASKYFDEVKSLGLRTKDGEVTIEFNTAMPPDANGHPVEVTWTLDEGGYLYLTSIKAFNRFGAEIHSLDQAT